MTKHVKHLRIYNDKHHSFITLRNQKFFSFLYKYNKLDKSLIETTITIIRDTNISDEYEKEQFLNICKEYLEYAIFINDDDINDSVIHEYCLLIYECMSSKNKNTFRGDLVEFVNMYLEKTNRNKVFHEPFFYYKRKRLFKDAFPGSNCLLDLVVVHNNYQDIRLIECKASLDTQIRYLLKKDKKIKNKLNFMDKLEYHISDYINYEDDKVRVKKILATINQPVLDLPSKYKRYEIVNLFDQIKGIQEPIL